MKIFLLSIFIFYTTFLNACYIPCDDYANQKSQEAQEKITSSYDKLNEQIEKSENAYDEYHNSIKKQNEILEKIIKTRKFTITQMKRINFLLTKIIENKNITIDIKILNAIRKLNENNTILRKNK